MVGWHHQLNGHGFGWTSGVGDWQGGLACCSSWGHKESNMTERLNWTDWLLKSLPSQKVLNHQELVRNASGLLSVVLSRVSPVGSEFLSMLALPLSQWQPVLGSLRSNAIWMAWKCLESSVSGPCSAKSSECCSVWLEVRRVFLSYFFSFLKIFIYLAIPGLICGVQASSVTSNSFWPRGL